MRLSVLLAASLYAVVGCGEKRPAETPGDSWRADRSTQETQHPGGAPSASGGESPESQERTSGRFPPLCRADHASWCSESLRVLHIVAEGDPERALRRLEELGYPGAGSDGASERDVVFSFLRGRAVLESGSLSYGSEDPLASQAQTILQDVESKNLVLPGERPGFADRVSFQLSRAALALGRGEEALGRLAELGPRYDGEAEVQAAWGIAYLSTGRVRESLAPLRNAARLDPDEPERHLVLGTAAMLAGDTGSAERSFRKALALDGGSARAHGDLGALLLLVGRVDEGRAHLERASRLAPTKATYLANLAYAELLTGHPEACESLARQALSLDETLSSAWLNYGLCLVALGRNDQAKEAFGRARDLDPDDPRPENNLRDLEELEAE